MRSLPGVSLSDRDRKTLGAGAAVILTLVVVFKLIPAWRAWVHDTRAADQELKTAVVNARANLQQRHFADTLRARTNRYLSIRPALLSGATPAQAGARLASAIAEAAEVAGVRLGTVEIRPRPDSQPSDSLWHVQVHTDCSGDVRGITTFVQQLEASTTPLVAIRALTINQPDPNAPSTQPESLHADLLVEGLMRRDFAP